MLQSQRSICAHGLILQSCIAPACKVCMQSQAHQHGAQAVCRVPSAPTCYCTQAVERAEPARIERTVRRFEVPAVCARAAASSASAPMWAGASAAWRAPSRCWTWTTTGSSRPPRWRLGWAPSHSPAPSAAACTAPRSRHAPLRAALPARHPPASPWAQHAMRCTAVACISSGHAVVMLHAWPPPQHAGQAFLAVS